MTDYPALTVLGSADADAELAAMDAVRGFCGWHIAPAVTETLTVSAPGSRLLILPTLHLTAITSIVEDGLTISAADYNFTEYGAVKRLNGWWTRDVTVTFTHGYTTCPAGVKAAVSAMATAGTGTTGSVRIGQVSITNAASTVDSFADRIGQYRITRIA